MSEKPQAEPKPCPICGKPRNPQYAPFCSRRCADVDLGRWLKGAYLIPGAPVEEGEEEPAPGSGGRTSGPAD